MPSATRTVPLTATLIAVATAAAALGAAGALAGCNKRPPPPEEEMLVVTSDAAPLLRKFKSDAEAQDVVRRGEMVRLFADKGPMKWTGKMDDGKKQSRETTCLEVRLVDDGQQRFGFLTDFAERVSVPVTSHLCAELAGAGSFDTSQCPNALRRARTASGDLVVWIVCNSGNCPVGVLHDGELQVTGVEGVVDSRYYQGKRRSLLVLSRRWWSDGGKQSGGGVVPIVIEGGKALPEKEIEVDRVDSRAADKIVARLATPSIGVAEVSVTGEEVVKDGDGKTLASKVVAERYGLPGID